MLRYLPQPLHPGVLVGRIRLTGSDIDLARDGLVDDGLLLLLQQLDQPFLGADVALDTPVGVVEEAGDGGLLGERRKGDQQALELTRVDVHYRNASSHTSLLGNRLPTIRAPTNESGVKIDGRPKDDHVAAANCQSTDEIDCRLSDFRQGLARPSEQNVTVANARVCRRAVMGNAGFALSDEELVSGIEVAVADAWKSALRLIGLGSSVPLEESTSGPQPPHVPVLRHLTQQSFPRESTGRIGPDARHHASGAPSSICRSNACRTRLMM